MARIALTVLLFLVFIVPGVMGQQDGGSNAVSAVVEPPPLVPIDFIIDETGGIWGIEPDDFMKHYRKLGFIWTSERDKNAARAYARPLTLFDMPVYEVIVRFENQKAVEVVISVYNRGDAGEIAKQQFEQLLRAVESRMSALAKVRSVKAPTQLDSGGVNKDGLVWTAANSQFKLEWSYSTGGSKSGFRYRPEYIRINAQSAGAAKNYQSSMQAKQSLQSGISRSALKANVKSESNGDVFIDNIPMVDQGLKGYCVVATMERVMRYYGREVDQHELAQLAQTQTGGGTSMETMINVLRRLGLAVGCKVLIHEDWDWKNFQKLVDAYNRNVRRTNVPEIIIPTHGTIMVSELYDQLQENPLREVKLQKKADYAKFKSTVQNYVKQGIPLPWTVCLGIVKEPTEILQRGPHMRMIIGFNLKTLEIIYTDSWGAKHERKNISMDDAWTMTDGLYTVEPRVMTY